MYTKSHLLLCILWHTTFWSFNSSDVAGPDPGIRPFCNSVLYAGFDLKKVQNIIKRGARQDIFLKRINIQGSNALPFKLQREDFFICWQCIFSGNGAIAGPN